MPGRILIVESDEAVRGVLCRAFQGQGIEADELHDGTDALGAIHSGRYAIVLLELRTPVVDGFSIVRAIRDDVQRPVVIALSAGDDDVRRLAGDPVVTLSIDKRFALSNLGPVVAAIAAVSRSR